MPGSRQLEYRDLAWCYRDIYFGLAAFSGQETVSHEEVPVWAMVYAGGVLPDAARPPRGVYACLRRSLALVPVIVLLGVLALNRASEAVSFTKVIDRVAPLRALDRAGRLP